MSKVTISSPDCIRYSNGQAIGYTNASPSSVEAAIADASSGDIICVFKNQTITSNLAKNGVNWEFAPGVTITMSQSTGWIFDDGGSNVSYTVRGGNFVRSFGSSLVGNQTYDRGGINVSGSGSSVAFVDVESFSFTIANGAGALSAMVACQGGSLSILGADLTMQNADALNSSNTLGVWWSGGTITATFNDMVDTSTTGEPVLIVADVETGSSDIDGFINAASIISPAINTAVAIQNESTNAKAALWVNANKIIGTITPEGGKTYVTVQKLLGNVDGQNGNLSNPTEFHLIAEKIGGDLTLSTLVTGPYIYLPSNNLKAWIQVNRFDVGANATTLITQSGTVTTFLSGMDFSGASNQDCIVCSKGTINILSGMTTASGTGKDLHQSSTGTINVGPGFVYNGSNTTGTITPLKFIGTTPGSTFKSGIGS